MWEEIKEEEFAKKFPNVYSMYANNDVWVWIEQNIESLLKQQREICADAYIKQRDYHVARTITSDVILNAPEPTGENI